MLTDVHGTLYHVSEHCKINVATALEVRFCTCLSRACRSTSSLRMVKDSTAPVYLELRSDNFVAKAG